MSEEENGPSFDPNHPEDVRVFLRQEGGEKHRVNERTSDPLRQERKVAVKGANGELENDWVIDRFEEGGNTVVVRKASVEEGQEHSEQKLSVHELEELNPPNE